MDIFREPKKQKSWIDPGKPSTSFARPNRFGNHIWLDQKTVEYHELLKPGDYSIRMINLKHLLIEKRTEWAIRYGKVILQNENALSRTVKANRDIISALGWELLPYLPY